MPTDTALAQVAAELTLALPARVALPVPPWLPLPPPGSPVVLRVGGRPFAGILRDYGTPVPAPVERSPFAADPEPRPDAERQQGR